MAKYEDYAKKLEEDGLQAEIDQASEQAEHRQEAENELPERFQGKTPAEIAESYAELEKAYSRQGNDLGEMRRTMDDFIKLQSAPTPSQEPSPAAEITVDELYDDPNAAIRSVVKEETASEINNLKEALAQAELREKLGSLDNKFDGWRDTTQTPEFVNWATESPYRKRLLAAGDQYDMDAAEELLGLYYETREASGTAQREQALRDASLEQGGPEHFESEETFSRTDLTKHRIAAGHGVQDSIDYLKANSNAILAAYGDNRIVD